MVRGQKMTSKERLRLLRIPSILLICQFVTLMACSPMSGDKESGSSVVDNTPEPVLGPNTARVGGQVTAVVTADGTEPFTYQWRKNQINIVGANQSTFRITSVTVSDAANYEAIVSNSAGSASATASLHVYDPRTKTIFKAPRLLGTTLEPQEPSDLKFKIEN
jgi:hypothetical protein